MEKELHSFTLPSFSTVSGKNYEIPLSWQVFGRPLHTAPVVLINHALTGNSLVSGEGGWWTALVGAGKTVDTDRYTVICFNVPGNGYDGFLLPSYADFTTRDVARLFLSGLEHLGVRRLYALIGGSVGGSIGWEMLALKNDLTERFVPIATDYKTSDWLHSQCLIQRYLLESEESPLEKARQHAMLCYRTPASLNRRFGRARLDGGVLKSQDWLDFHGRRLRERFSLEAYRLMNHLLTTIEVSKESLLAVEVRVHLLAVDSDLFYPAFEIKETYEYLKNAGKTVFYHEMTSVHGHDAFLMEYDQLNEILIQIMNDKNDR
ncbi:alpha/beta fold hydrolase [Bergeyella sp. RCAD1439]|uniref:alpha/beta fold hydrolase n=1 Tax=Bergeyella anatis TaxID=3113737 RepID=UPI002E197A5F|nr:alpha/beta fold hydrolase [Bergeyella sp. RCAD1439]